MRIVWTPVAVNSLGETVNFITELWSPQIADTFLNQLDYRIEQIIQNPEIAPPFKNSYYRQLFIHKTVSLFYKIDKDYIKILLIWDNRQDPAKLLKTITSST
jgi:plasmid stabilization system protein ParE